jgi:hypothetical protein
MRISRAYKSKYLKTADIAQPVTYTINRVAQVQFDGIEKPVAYFAETPQGLILNRTNSLRLAATFGDDTDFWTGRRVTLRIEDVPFNGGVVASIQAWPDQPGSAATGAIWAQSPLDGAAAKPGTPRRAAAKAADKNAGSFDDLEDELPFYQALPS